MERSRAATHFKTVSCRHVRSNASVGTNQTLGHFTFSGAFHKADVGGSIQCVATGLKGLFPLNIRGVWGAAPWGYAGGPGVACQILLFETKRFNEDVERVLELAITSLSS